MKLEIEYLLKVMDCCYLLKLRVKLLVKFKVADKVKKLLDHAKQSATDVLKNASVIAIQKTAELAGDLISIIVEMQNICNLIS